MPTATFPPGLAAFRRTVHERAIPKALFDALLDGMEMDLTVTRYPDFAALDLYCYRVAGRGRPDDDPRLRLPALRAACPGPWPSAPRCSSRTSSATSPRTGRWAGVYLPQDELARFGVTEAQIAEGRCDDRFRALDAMPDRPGPPLLCRGRGRHPRPGRRVEPADRPRDGPALRRHPRRDRAARTTTSSGPGPTSRPAASSPRSPPAWPSRAGPRGGPAGSDSDATQVTAHARPRPLLRTSRRPGAQEWWYFDAICDDGEHALVIVWYAGLPFDPDYGVGDPPPPERPRPIPRPDPLDHAAIGLSLYRAGKTVAYALNRYPAATGSPIGPSRSRSPWRGAGSTATGAGYRLHVETPARDGRRTIRADLTLHPGRGRPSRSNATSAAGAGRITGSWRRPIAGSRGRSPWTARRLRARLPRPGLSRPQRRGRGDLASPGPAGDGAASTSARRRPSIIGPSPATARPGRSGSSARTAGPSTSGTTPRSHSTIGDATRSASATPAPWRSTASSRPPAGGTATSSTTARSTSAGSPSSRSTGRRPWGSAELLEAKNLHKPWFNWMIPYRLKSPRD